MSLEGYGAKKLNKEFLNKGWGLRGLNKLFRKCCKKTFTKTG